MRFAISLIILFLPGMVQAQSTFLNRPSETESAIVLEKGVWQIESAYEAELTGLDDEEEKEIFFPGILLSYGLGWGIELRVANQYETFSDGDVSFNGITDIDLGAKFKLLSADDEETEMALLSHFFFPTGSTGISNERVGNESLLLVWHGLTDKLGIEYNIGYSNYEIDSEKGNFVYSLVTDYEINDMSGIFIETHGELIEFEELEANVDIGLAFQVTDNFELELAAGTGINHKVFLTLIGLSWRIGEQED